MSIQDLQTLLAVQSQGYKDALQLFITRFDAQHDKLLHRIENLEKTCAEKDRLNNDLLNHIVKVEQELESVKQENQKLQNTVTGTPEDSGLQSKVSVLEDRCNDLEDRSRRSNLRVFGLAEDPDETWDKTRSKVAELCTERLGLPEIRLEVAHRTGPRRPNKPRAVVARFQRFDDREAVMRNAAKLKGTGIHIHEDLCAASLKKRNDQWPQLQEHRNKGNFARFYRSRLVVREQAKKSASSAQTPADSGNTSDIPLIQPGASGASTVSAPSAPIDTDENSRVTTRATAAAANAGSAEALAKTRRK